MSDSVHLRIKDTHVAVRSTVPGFIAFLSEFLETHVEGPVPSADVEVDFEGVETFLRTPPRTARRPGEERLGYGIDWRGDALRYEDESLSATCEWHSTVTGNPRLRVRGQLRRRLHQSARALVSRRSRNAEFMEAYRKFVLWPVATVEAVRQKAVLLHGLLLARGDEGVLCVGLGGVGKTTLAAELYAQGGWDVLSDNFVFVSERYAWGVREPMRFNASDAARLRALSAGAGRMGTAGGRRAVAGLLTVRESVRVDRVFVTALADRDMREPMTPARCADEIEDSMLLLRELGLDSFPRVLAARMGVGLTQLRHTLEEMTRAAECARLLLGRTTEPRDPLALNP